MTKLKYILSLFFVLKLIYTESVYAVVFYVTENGTGDYSGISWSNSKRKFELQSTIDNANVGDEIWVAKGVYFTSYVGLRSESFHLKNGVKLIGNFNGDETSINQRKIVGGILSILSAEIGGSNLNDNSFHVISNSNLNSTAIIDGFIIQNGYDDRNPNLTDGLGGGIYNEGSNSSECSPIIKNCIIKNNYATYGGGIFNNGYNFGKSSPIIENCIFHQNSAIAGAGLDNFGLLNGEASPIIINSIFLENTASERAGAIYCWGGNSGNANPFITNCNFVKNSAQEGGGIVSDNLNSSSGASGNSNPELYNCIFEDNSSSILGPHFFLRGDGNISINNSIINLVNQLTPHTISNSSINNLSISPLFLNEKSPLGIDGVWFTEDDGFQLTELSPCIENGVDNLYNVKDIIGVEKINFKRDIGVFEFKKDSLNSLNENQDVHLIQLYPNPTNSDIYLKDTYFKYPFQYQIFNSLGVSVLKGDLTNCNHPISLGLLSSGIYIVQLKDLVFQIIKL